MNTLRWNGNHNPYNLIQENAFANVAREMAAILSRPQYVNIALPDHAFIFRIQCDATVSGYIITCHTDINSDSKEKVERQWWSHVGGGYCFFI